MNKTSVCTSACATAWDVHDYDEVCLRCSARKKQRRQSKVSDTASLISTLCMPVTEYFTGGSSALPGYIGV